jgi:IclR helix-turn-helix domain
MLEGNLQHENHRTSHDVAREQPLSPCNGATPQRSSAADEPSPERRQELWQQCKHLALQPRILDGLVRELEAQGTIGEQRAAKLIYLLVTSRLLRRPISGAVKGPSSGGKSHAASKVLSFFPPSAFSDLTSTSEKALIYDKEDLTHRTIVMAEAAGLVAGFGAYVMRSLLTEGRIKYKTVVIGPDGPEGKTIEREGPTNLLVTTTAIHLEKELETRLLSIPIDDSREQTSGVIRAQAARYSGTLSDAEPDLSAWRALQEWLATAERRVVIPFAEEFAELVPPVALRLRRDIPAILGLVATHAILHQASRHRDNDGRIVATLDDYAAIRELVADLVAEAAGASVPKTIRQTVAAVEELRSEKYIYCDQGVGLKAIADVLGLDKSTVSRRVNAAEEKGYLANEETKAGRPARIMLGDSLPEELAVLPTAEALQRCCASAGETECEKKWRD